MPAHFSKGCKKIKTRRRHRWNPRYEIRELWVSVGFHPAECALASLAGRTKASAPPFRLWGTSRLSPHLSRVSVTHLILIRFTATPGRPCDTSPPGLHKDGEKYIATLLIGRCGAVGGEVVITDNDKRELDRFTMREMGESYVFDDDRIWHMLTPVAVMEGNQFAYRDTLAFDMLPEGWEPVG